MIRDIVRILRALARRDMVGRLTYRLGFLAEFVAAALFFVAVFNIGKLVPRQMLAGQDYFTVTMIGIGLYSFASGVMAAPRGFLSSELSNGTLEMLLTLGPGLGSFLAAHAIYQAGRLLIRTALVLTVAWLLGRDLALAGAWRLGPVLVLAGCASFGIGMLQAGLELKVRRARHLVNLVGAAGAILTGVYFPLTLLPPWLRSLSLLLPAAPAIEASRSALMGNGLPGRALLTLAIQCAVYLAAGWLLFRAGARSQRREGTFAAY